MNDGQVLLIGDDIAVANTQYGKVRGYVLRGINYFLGIPYGADTSGANRFMPPQKPKPWTNVFPAIWWGNSAPQDVPTGNRYADRYMAFKNHQNRDDVGEDCLRINVFTPAINDGKKRPVMFWCHGGGFRSGSGNNSDAYNGENLARFGDVVFCSINHRLGPFGYCDFSTVGGEKFATSGTVGVMDIVAALEWVRDNIANFGGDPGNVTIMGQSGGGGKVSALTAMPSAKGLFHKAVVLSGVRLKLGETDYCEKLGAYVLKESGLTAGEMDKLQQMPWRDFDALAMRAFRKLNQELGPAVDLGAFSPEFEPVVGNSVLPQHPFFPEAAPTSAQVPMIISSVLNESSAGAGFGNNGPLGWKDPAIENITMDQVVEKIAQRPGFDGDKARQAVEAYAKEFHGKKPIDIWSYVDPHRRLATSVANAKSKLAAPVYNAWFWWQPPLFDNHLRAFHGLDTSFWYYNTDLMLTDTGGGPRPKKLSEKIAGTLVQFMRTGNPNGKGLPNWPKYTSAKGEVMILDDVCEVKNDPDREARKALPASLT
jgi:para-nitrobenzyl esterase